MTAVRKKYTLSYLEEEPADIEEYEKHKEGIAARVRRYAYYFMSLLIFLTITAAMGTSIYIGLLAIGPIAAGLVVALPLGIPVVALSIIGGGILIASVIAMLRFVQIHWEIHQKLKRSECREKETLKAMASSPLRYVFTLFMAAFVINWTTADAINAFNSKGDDKDNPSYLPDEVESEFEDTSATERLRFAFRSFDISRYMTYLSSAAGLGLGIALAVPLAPFVMATVMASFALPYGVALLFAAVAAATIIAVSYALVALAPIRLLRLLKVTRNRSLILADFGIPRDPVGIALVTVAGSLAIAAAYLFFVPLINVLAPVLASSGLATFLAVAVSFSLVVGMMTLVAVYESLKSVWIKGNKSDEDLSKDSSCQRYSSFSGDRTSMDEYLFGHRSSFGAAPDFSSFPFSNGKAPQNCPGMSSEYNARGSISRFLHYPFKFGFNDDGGATDAPSKVTAHDNLP